MDDRDRRPDAPPDTLDDEALGAMVRDVADGWRMPPQRLGQRTWRDRIEGPGDRGDRPTWRRVALPVGGAIAATVVLAVAAAWLGGQDRHPATGAASPSASPAAAPSGSGTATASPRPSPTAAATPAPTLFVEGDRLPVDSLILQSDGPRVLDLRTGVLGDSLASDPMGRSLVVLDPAGAGATCVCIAFDKPSGDDPTAFTIELVHIDGSGPGTETGRRALGTYGGGRPDPEVRWFGTSVDAAISRSSRPGVAYLGWTVRRVDGWASGVDVLDLAAGKVVQHIELGAQPLTEGNDGLGRPTGTFLQAPTVVESPDGSALVIHQLRARMGRTAAGTVSDLLGTTPDRWSARVTDGTVGALTAFASGEGSLGATDCDLPYAEAFAGADTYSAICGSSRILRRVDLSGRPLGDVTIGLDGDGMVTSLSDRGGVRYLWLPFQRRLVRVDPDGTKRSITIDQETAAAADPPADPLSALGSLGRQLADWIAPAARAKIYLDPALAIAPDGSRLYILGTTAQGIVPVEGTTDGSAGIHVVDARTLEVLGTWAPTADYTSIAVSRDGSLVYAIGAPGVRQQSDGSASVDATIAASLTVFDASSGKVRAVAGQLGDESIRLDPALIP